MISFCYFWKKKLNLILGVAYNMTLMVWAPCYFREDLEIFNYFLIQEKIYILGEF